MANKNPWKLKTKNFFRGTGKLAFIVTPFTIGLSLGINAALRNRMRTNLQATPQRMSPTNYPTDKRIPYNHLGTQGLSLALFNRRHNVIF